LTPSGTLSLTVPPGGSGKAFAVHVFPEKVSISGKYCPPRVAEVAASGYGTIPAAMQKEVEMQEIE
jgi:hypothetical protein